jgi:hypothetical protein
MLDQMAISKIEFLKIYTDTGGGRVNKVIFIFPYVASIAA